jgi:hypothetical protein
MGFLRAAHMLTALPALRRAGAMAALPPAAAAGPGGRGLLLWGARPAARRPKSGGARCWWGQSGAGGLCCAWRWGSMRAVRGAAAWWWGSPPAAPGPHITCSYKLAARGAGLQAHGKDLCAPLMQCRTWAAGPGGVLVTAGRSLRGSRALCNTQLCGLIGTCAPLQAPAWRRAARMRDMLCRIRPRRSRPRCSLPCNSGLKSQRASGVRRRGRWAGSV